MTRSSATLCRLAQLATAVALSAAAGCVNYTVDVTHPAIYTAEPAPARVGIFAFEADKAREGAIADNGCLDGARGTSARIVERAQVAAALAEKGPRAPGPMRPEDIRSLGASLGVEAFLVGAVDPTYGGLPPNVTVRLMSAKTGALLSIASVHRSSRAGEIKELRELAAAACRVAITGTPEEL